MDRNNDNKIIAKHKRKPTPSTEKTFERLKKQYEKPSVASRKFKNALWPPFSERELIILLLACIAGIIDSWHYWLEVIRQDPQVGLGILLLGVPLIWLVCFHAFSPRVMSPTHKKLLSTIFYITLGVLSVSSTFPLIGRWLLVDPSTDGLFDLINKVSLVWITFRALAMATATAAITKARQEEYLISQVRNEQVDLNMLLIIPAAVLFSYMLLRKDSDGATAIILSYFYTNTGIIFFERLVGKKPS